MRSMRLLISVLCLSLAAPVVAWGQNAGKSGKQSSGKKRKSSKRKSSKGKSSKSRQGKSGGLDLSEVPPDKKAEKKALKLLGSSFETQRTKHYSVLYDTTQEEVDEFGSAIERTYRSCMKYTSKLGVPVKKPKRKLLIYYVSEHQDYSDLSERLHKGPRAQSTPGVYFPDLNIGMFYNFRNQDSFKQARESSEKKIADLQEQLRRTSSSSDRRAMQKQIQDARRLANRSNVVGGGFSEAIVQHEVAHQVLWNIGFHNPRSFFTNPRWFAEGTAMLFEPVSTGGSANIGRVNAMRLREYESLASGQRLFPVREFISKADYFGPQTIGRAYAQSWALVHYLNRVKKKKLRKYVALLNKRSADYVPTPEQEIKDFESIFGEIDRFWERRWRDWMKNVR